MCFSVCLCTSSPGKALCSQVLQSVNADIKDFHLQNVKEIIKVKIILQSQWKMRASTYSQGSIEVRVSIGVEGNK